MADVVFAYTPADGAAFSPSGWNGDIHSTTDGVSLYGELNGHLQNANFAAGEKFSARHIRPYEGFRSEYGGDLDTLDFYENLYGTQSSDDDYIAIPGCSRRVYVPWDSSVVIYHVGVFYTNLRMREVTSNPAGGAPVYSGPAERLKLYVDDAQVGHTLRELPYTYYCSNWTGEALYLGFRENVLTHHYDCVHMVQNVTAGWHEVSLRALVLLNIGKETLYPLYDTNATAKTDHDVNHRIRCGIRSASVICLP